MPLVKATETDSHGHFDFGVLETGHYTLIVDDEGWGHSNWFDVEIESLTQKTVSVTIDISPHFPDCKGGHEFIVNTK
ncbi:MAG: hypothetical protein HY233_13670 [Acidobacteriales bacterium]|nr:hypothetical protein [Terriglobales bacterium]